MDRRQEKTQAIIIEAFIQLLMKKSYNKITVKEIIDTANIGRSTFYNHYETKDELLEALCDHLFDHVFAKNNQFNKDAKHIITHMLYHLQEDHIVLTKLLVSESSELFVKYFKQYLCRMEMNALIEPFLEAYPDIPKDCIQNHIVTSFVSMVQYWLANKMKQTPEEISHYFVQMVLKEKTAN